MGVVARQGEADSDLHPGVSAQADAAQRHFERALAAAEPVVRRRQPVQADADIVEPRLRDGPHHLIVDQGPVGGQRQMEAHRPGVGRQFEQVGTQQRLAAGQDQRRYAIALQVVQHRERLERRQFTGELAIGRESVAVQAGEVAAAHQIPDDDRADAGSAGGSYPGRFRVGGAQSRDELAETEHVSSLPQAERRRPLFLRMRVL